MVVFAGVGVRVARSLEVDLLNVCGATQKWLWDAVQQRAWHATCARTASGKSMGLQVQQSIAPQWSDSMSLRNFSLGCIDFQLQIGPGLHVCWQVTDGSLEVARFTQS